MHAPDLLFSQILALYVRQKLLQNTISHFIRYSDHFRRITTLLLLLADRFNHLLLTLEHPKVSQ